MSMIKGDEKHLDSKKAPSVQRACQPPSSIALIHRKSFGLALKLVFTVVSIPLGVTQYASASMVRARYIECEYKNQQSQFLEPGALSKPEFKPLNAVELASASSRFLIDGESDQRMTVGSFGIRFSPAELELSVTDIDPIWNANSLPPRWNNSFKLVTTSMLGAQGQRSVGHLWGFLKTRTEPQLNRNAQQTPANQGSQISNRFSIGREPYVLGAAAAISNREELNCRLK